MKNFKQLFLNDLKRYLEYRIFYVFVTIIFIFSIWMALFPSADPSNFIFVSIFIIPVILFSISLYIEREEGTILPKLETCCRPSTLVAAKILSALSLQLIPVILYSLVFRFFLHLDISYVAFIFAYLFGALLHIVIGLSLSIISKSNQILSISYIAYIVIFSIIPIFYENNLVPISFQYVLIVSPAFLSGVLLGNILAGVMYSSLALVLIAIFLQLAYLAVLITFVIRPFMKNHLIGVANNVRHKEDPNDLR